ncbi:hypothetical protein [Pseudomonas akapageensis]|uniref:hypothetical protein n=1 Tax=Pseudomonas akapageensis TaxID=2609961 RepID=UPI001FED2938|nr:hypothetical protein [Pseudomonas akapageensis]
MSYFYKTESATVLAAARACDNKKAAWNAQREMQGQAFGGAASPMYSGSRNYVGGIKLSANTRLDVHCSRADKYGDRALRRAAKHVNDSDKEVRAAEKVEHQRSLDLWTERCPDVIDQDQMWQAIGVNTGGIWMTGGVCFESGGVVCLNLGCKAEGGRRRSGRPERNPGQRVRSRAPAGA